MPLEVARVAVADLADRERVDLVIVGPEAPLAAGVADLLNDRVRGERLGYLIDRANARLRALVDEGGLGKLYLGSACVRWFRHELVVELMGK